MKVVDTANERPDQALSFAISTTFTRLSVDEWHVLKVVGLRCGGVFAALAAGRRGLYISDFENLSYSTYKDLGFLPPVERTGPLKCITASTVCALVLPLLHDLSL